jgi:hypothetical protein
MNTATYRARWVSPQRLVEIKRKGQLADAKVLDLFNGSIVIEPADRPLGDGPVLSRQDVERELQPAWHLGAARKLTEARQLLGLNHRPG